MRSNIQTTIIDRVLGIRRDRRAVIVVGCARQVHRLLEQLFHEAHGMMLSTMSAGAQAAQAIAALGKRSQPGLVPVRVTTTTQTWQVPTSFPTNGFGSSSKPTRYASKRGLRSY